jgi:ergothioneine biosynthesis protein EgtB
MSPETLTQPQQIDRQVLADVYKRNRARSQALLDLLTEEAYYERPIDLRHPIVFYEGHLPAFSFNTLVKRGLGRASIDARLEALFERGIDPPDRAGTPASRDDEASKWPERSVVRAFADEADRQVLEALAHADLEVPGHRLLDRAEAVYTILEHEAMHQETLRYMWHRLPYDRKHRPADYYPKPEGAAPRQELVEVPRGRATLGVDRTAIRFAWDNEMPATIEDVRAFSIERHATSNQAYLAFVEAGGYRDERWWRPDDWAWIRQERVSMPRFWELRDGQYMWRGMFDLLPLPLAWPVYVSFAEAWAFARWQNMRLPSEGEYQRAAYGTVSGGERPYPWGNAAPDGSRGVFDFASWDPEAAGSHPAGRSAWGVEDLVGNGWQWTSTPFAPFEGFRAMPSYPQYSADFFDEEHFVIKGASPATAKELIRPTFRNWFRPRYPYVYATFRCVRAR